MTSKDQEETNFVLSVVFGFGALACIARLVHLCVQFFLVFGSLQ